MTAKPPPAQKPSTFPTVECQRGAAIASSKGIELIKSMLKEIGVAETPRPETR